MVTIYFLLHKSLMTNPTAWSNLSASVMAKNLVLLIRGTLFQIQKTPRYMVIRPVFTEMVCWSIHGIWICLIQVAMWNGSTGGSLRVTVAALSMWFKSNLIMPVWRRLASIFMSDLLKPVLNTYLYKKRQNLWWHNGSAFTRGCQHQNDWSELPTHHSYIFNYPAIIFSSLLILWLSASILSEHPLGLSPSGNKYSKDVFA